MNSARIRFFIRIALMGLILTMVGFIGWSFFNAQPSVDSIASSSVAVPFENREPIAPPRDNITVFTGQGFGEKSEHALIALAPDGRVLYYEDKYDSYHDVDPSPEGKLTVLFIGKVEEESSKCGANYGFVIGRLDTGCTRNFVERVNLSTGERTRVYSITMPGWRAGDIHDVDRLDSNHLLVGDITYDRVYIVNTTSNVTEFQWSAKHDFSISGGGKYPKDWTHLNDVEQLPDGRIMASLRNQDQVVFLDPNHGLMRNWTLGGEDRYNILFEQHNPDYIPVEAGGPAVVVADSQNHRIIEYQRDDGQWEPVWTWHDDQLQWPRDADRLPNGHTLISDSNGGRLIEIDEAGEIVWQIEVESIYEAERLGTGDESAGGPSATRASLESTDSREGIQRSDPRKGLLPPKVRSAIFFVVPGWAWWQPLAAALLSMAVVVIWFWMELRWRSISISLRSPLSINRGRD